MDILLVAQSIYELPSTQRVGALVYEGVTDLRLRKGPGPDRQLSERYGPDLPTALDRERERAGEAPEFVRIHPGRLRCDFLLWAASALEAEGASEVERLVTGALDFVASRSVERVGFAPGVTGHDADRVVERLVSMARAAHTYEEQCFAAGRPPGVEQVLLCWPERKIIRAAERQVSRIASGVEFPSPIEASAARQARAPRSTGRRKMRQRLPEDELSHGRNVAVGYDKSATYAQGQWLSHPRFGVGRVEMVTKEGAILILFEDGEQRRLVHARG